METKKKGSYVALINARIGSNKDGSPKKVIKAGDKLKLTKEEAASYKQQGIINY